MSEFEYGEIDAGDTKPSQHQIEMAEDALEEFESILNQIESILKTSAPIIGCVYKPDVKNCISDCLLDYYCGEEIVKAMTVARA